MEFFSLLFLSFPVFYIIGIIATIRHIFGKKSATLSREQFLQQAIDDLELLQQRHSIRTIEEQLQKYRTEYDALTGVSTERYDDASEITQDLPIHQDSEINHNPNADGHQRIFSPTASQNSRTEVTFTRSSQVESLREAVDINSLWSNWYSENSINFLLYLGSFLIVASVSIFVGFQWETLDGLVKSLLLFLLTAAFFVCGMWFYSSEKIRTAGSTFIAIGAILIPFNGIALYNFVLEPIGSSFGIVWLLTSLISASVYTLLAYSMKNKIYTYIAGLGGLSMMLSVVNSVHVSSQFYILSGILYAFILLLLTKLFKTSSDQNDELFYKPLTLSSQIIMPLTLGFGLITAYSTGMIYTVESFLSCFLASLYYGVVYTMLRNTVSLVAAQVLFPTGVFLMLRTYGIEPQRAFALTQTIPIGYLLLRYYNFIPDSIIQSFLQVSHILTFSLFGLSVLFSIVEGIERPLVSSAFLSFSYAAMAYSMFRTREWMTATAALFPLTVILFTFWQNISIIHTAMIVQIISFAYVGIYTHYYNREVSVADIPHTVSQIMMISALAIGLVDVLNVQFIAHEHVLISAFSLLFYSLVYYLTRQPIHLIATLVLFPATGYLAGIWLDIKIEYIHYGLQLITAGYMYVSYRYTDFFKSHKSYIMTGGLLLSITTPLISIAMSHDMFHVLIFSMLCTVWPVIMSYVDKKVSILFVSFIFYAFSWYIMIVQLLNISDAWNILGLIYVISSILLYIIALSRPTSDEAHRIFIIGVGAFLICGSMLTVTDARFFIVANIFASGLLLDASRRYQIYPLIYASNAMTTLSLWSFLRILHVDITWYPIWYTILAYMMYGVSMNLSSYRRTYYENSALFGMLIQTIFFGMSAASVAFTTDDNFMRNSLIASYATTVLYGYHAYRIAQTSFGYIASAFGMATYCWHIWYSGISEVQFFSVPLGTYFLVIGYLESLRGNKQYQENLNLFGLLILFIPALLQAFGGEGTLYALILGLLGVVILSIGITLASRMFMYSGAASLAFAVISQTYNYLFSLPRWGITAILGLLFLIIAIYLMWKRNE